MLLLLTTMLLVTLIITLTCVTGSVIILPSKAVERRRAMALSSITVDFPELYETSMDHHHELCA